ncbi:MAG: thioesterase family protein [Candidatus Neomarinimicrobiota bacterium]|nr:thioesterase family protein [Candidatus Neomarinimicrobiota bacterium]MED5248390.1 thioesterase family protein [Candidatus Neomarinimicrobiota bacterium]
MISHNFHVKVYYKDIDQMGIVYYSRYFEFFELARTELLKSIGFAVKDIEKNDFFLPVVSASCEYIKSASFEDTLIIESQIIKTPSARLQIDYNIISENDQSVIAKGKTVHGFINRKGKPKKPPKALIEKIELLLSNER